MATIYGTYKNTSREVIPGTPQDDLIYPLGGWDYIDGGAGVDTIVISGVSTNFEIVREAGVVFVDSLSAASAYAERTQITNIENIQFNDLTVSLAGSLRYDALPGNDEFVGGPSIDWVVMSGKIADHQISKRGIYYFVYDQKGTGGEDRLQSIERIVFSDKTLAILEQSSTSAVSWKLSSAGAIYSVDGKEVVIGHSESVDQIFFSDGVSKSLMSLLPQAKLSAAGAYDAKVQAYFIASLGRKATAQELKDYSSLLASKSGSVWLDASGQTGTNGSLVGALFSSAEFTALTATAVTERNFSKIVTEMYGRLTGDGTPSASLLSFYVSQLESGGIKVRGLANAMLNDLVLMPRADGILFQPNGWATNLRDALEAEDYLGYLTELELAGINVINLEGGVFG